MVGLERELHEEIAASNFRKVFRTFRKERRRFNIQVNRGSGY